MMKTLLKTFLISLFVVLGMNTINGQCNNGTNYYPASPYSPTDNAWSYATTNSWAGEVIQINARSGYDYIFSTCSTYGGITASYDTQLTLYDNRGNVVAYNDDYSGCSLQSVINYTALYDGVYYLHLTEYSCISNQTRTQVMIFCSPAAAPTTCATLDYIQDFETGNTNMSVTTGTQANASLDATAANGSSYGLHMEGNTSTGWGSSYSTGASAFSSSPTHIASVSREICAGTQQTLTLKFDKKQTSTYNANYCWFRLTVNGTPVSDDRGNIYFNRVNTYWTTLTYDLSSYAGTDITVAWESCAKYYTGYTGTGDGGDAVFIDNIEIIESTAAVPPTTPSIISGDHQPNEATQNLTYTVAVDNNVDTYLWTVPTNWTIISGQGTNSIIVAAGNYDGNISVVARNIAGSSSPRTLAVNVALIERTYPYSETFDNETNDITSASVTGFTFDANGWRNISGDNADWRTYSGTTPSSYTGTSGIDHSMGTSAGKYLYMESSSPMYPNKTFSILSPAFDLRSTTTPILTFWFNMETDNSNSELALTYSLDNGTTWSNDVAFMDHSVSSSPNVVGDMGGNWRQGLVDLTFLQPQRSVMFKITGTTGSTYSSDLCLDDVKLVDAASTSVDVGENLTIVSNYSGATGFVLNGTDAQVVTSNNSSIPDLTIDNGNGVTINGDLTVTALTLTNGHITVGSGDVLTTDGITGTFNTSNHIIGSLKRTSNNTLVKVFPIGDGSNYRPVLLIPQTSTTSEYTAIYNNVGHSSVDFYTYPNGTPTGNNLHSIANGYFWDIEKGVGSTPARIGIGWDATMNVSIATDIVVAHYNSSTSQWENIMGTNLVSGTAASGTAISDYTSDFSPFGFGDLSGGGVLPIDLLSFVGDVIEGNVVLDWEVLSQVNNDKFIVERSINVTDWEKVGEVVGAGNTNAEHSYRLVDVNPIVGTSYYRLTQVDYDGKSECFYPIKVYVENNIGLVISPNPVKDDLHLFAGEDLRGITDIVIFNILGEIVYEETFEGRFNKFNVNLRDLKKGSYIMKINNSAKQGTLKFIIE